jgi:hypothetical protein
MIARSAVSSLLLASVLLASAPALADPWLPEPGDRYYELSASVFSADSYYDLTGARSPLTAGGLHEERGFVSYSEFGWKKNMSALLEIPALSVTRRAGAPGGFNATETGFGDLRFGLRRRLASSAALEVQWLAPRGYDRALNPHLGEGRQSFVGSLELGGALGGRGFVEVSGGYRYFMDKNAPTDQVLGGATLGLWLGQKLLVAGRYRGSFGAEPDANNTFVALSGDAIPTTTNARITTQLAGPMLVYRVDDHLDLIGGSLHTAAAKNALHLDQFYVGVAVKQTRLNRLQGFLGGTRKP